VHLLHSIQEERENERNIIVPGHGIKVAQVSLISLRQTTAV